MGRPRQGSPHWRGKRRRTSEVRDEQPCGAELAQHDDSADELEYCDTLQWERRSPGGSSGAEDPFERSGRILEEKEALHEWEIDRAVAYYAQQTFDAMDENSDQEEIEYLEYLNSETIRKVKMLSGKLASEAYE